MKKKSHVAYDEYFTCTPEILEKINQYKERKGLILISTPDTRRDSSPRNDRRNSNVDPSKHTSVN